MGAPHVSVGLISFSSRNGKPPRRQDAKEREENFSLLLGVLASWRFTLLKTAIPGRELARREHTRIVRAGDNLGRSGSLPRSLASSTFSAPIEPGTVVRKLP